MLLDQTINDFILNFGNQNQLDTNLSANERMNVYTLYSLAFAKISRINSYFFSLVKTVNDCIKKGEVIALIPVKGFTKIDLIYAGTPPIFVIIYPFIEERYSITEHELLTITMDLLYQILFIQHVMEANTIAHNNGSPYVNLQDDFTQLKFQKLRLNSFKDFWLTNFQDFGTFRLPNNLDSLIN